MAGFGLGLWLVALILLFLLAVAWLLMPLLLLSIRRVLTQILQEQTHANALLEARLQHDKVELPRRPAAVRRRTVDRRYP